jgi:2-hydroxychromene-2-carboxylate isomerase
MADRDLRFYLDFKSPYAYLAIAPTRALEREHNIKFAWLPYVLNIPDFLGTVEGRNAHQWRRIRYSYMDARRLANRRGMTVKGPQKIFDSSTVAIGMLYAERRGVRDHYIDLAFERFWKRELDIEDRESVAHVVDESGTSAAAFFDFLDGTGREELARIAEAAEAAGVFGVPTFVIDGELFWGGDRIWMVQEKLNPSPQPSR